MGSEEQAKYASEPQCGLRVVLRGLDKIVIYFGEDLEVEMSLDDAKQLRKFISRGLKFAAEVSEISTQLADILP